ncbi:MAG TPA: hypothetical protein VK191_00665, partial [Symbiobacteriaceae bacterium]|nr:hypothetical protein [Symbiobacteriaceae bacterium]
RIWSRIGLAFAIIYAVIATFNYTVQLIVVRGNLFSNESPGLGLFAMANPHSLFWGLAMIGYNFYMALAALLIVPTLGQSTLERWIGWLFAANALASLVAGVYFFVTLDTYHFVGLVASGVWILAFPAATTLLAIRFRRMSKQD